MKIVFHESNFNGVEANLFISGLVTMMKVKLKCFKKKCEKYKSGLVSVLILFGVIVTPFATAQISQRVESYTYTPTGEIDQIDGPRTEIGISDVTDYNYDPVSLLLNEIIYSKNEIDLTYSFLNHNYFGKPEKLVDPNSVETLLQYNSYGSVTTRTIKHPLGLSVLDATTTDSRNSIDQITCTTSPEGSRTIYLYDNARRLTHEIEGASDCDHNINISGKLKKTEYNSNGDVLTISIFEGLSVNDPLIYLSSMTYDELGRLKSKAGNNGQFSGYEYDNSDFLTEHLESIDSQGASRATQFQPDPLSRIDYSDDAYSNRTDMEYDSDGNLLTVTDTRGNVTAYAYDDYGNREQISSPESDARYYVFDAASNITFETDGIQVIRSLSYDGLNRATEVIFPQNTAENLTYHYDDYSMDTTPDPAEASSFPVGQLTGLDSEHVDIRIYYDHRGNISKRKSLIGQYEYSLLYTYNLDDTIQSITYPSGVIVNYTYNSVGRVEQISADFKANGDVTPQTYSIVQNVDYLPFGPIRQLDFENGSSVVHSWDLDYRLVATKVYDSAPVLIKDRTYEYDLTGNITEITDAIVGARNYSYDYDLLDRLTKDASFSATSPTYQYDSAGNRLSFDNIFNWDSLTNNYSITYKTTSNRIESVTFGSGAPNNVSYNAVGSISQRVRSYIDDVGNHVAVTDVFNYNQANRLISVDVVGVVYSSGNPIGTIDIEVSYKYDGLGQRIETFVDQGITESRARFVYDTSGRVLQSTYTEYQNGISSSTPLTTNFIYLDGIPVAQLSTVNNDIDGTVEGSYKLFTFYNNHLGIAEIGFDTVGSNVWERETTGFGEQVTETHHVAQGIQKVDHKLMFPGQYFDDFTGLYYNYFRDYDPALGRYMQSDPIGILRDYSDPQLQIAIQMGLIEPEGLYGSLNHLYGYANQNPVNFIDPTGLDSLRAALMQAIARGNTRQIRNIMDALSDPKLRKAAQDALDKFGSKADDWIGKQCKGSINREFPESLRNKTLEEIRRGKSAEYKKAWKLLNDKRFQK